MKRYFGKAWPRSKVALVGFLVGRGRSSAQIARALDDGTSSQSIRRQWKRWALPLDRGAGGAPLIIIPVEINSRLRVRLFALAQARKLSPEEWLRRIVAVAIKDDLFDAVVGDDE